MHYLGRLLDVGVKRKPRPYFQSFGISRIVRGVGGRELNCDVLRHLCRWLRADIQFSPANHPRGQGAVERLGGWMLDMLAELCIAWPKR